MAIVLHFQAMQSHISGLFKTSWHEEGLESGRAVSIGFHFSNTLSTTRSRLVQAKNITRTCRTLLEIVENFQKSADCYKQAHRTLANTAGH